MYTDPGMRVGEAQVVSTQCFWCRCSARKNQDMQCDDKEMQRQNKERHRKNQLVPVELPLGSMHRPALEDLP